MKKILHIVEAFGGGIFTVLIDVLNELANDNDYEIYLAYSKRSQTPENYKELINSKIKLIEVNNFTREIDFYKDFKAFFELRRIIKMINPDIIHLHSSKAGFLGRFAVSTKKYKMYYNPHGFSFLMKNTSKLKRSLYWLIEKIGGLRKCTIVACSESEKKEALKLSRNVICINNGINIQDFEKCINNFKKRELNLKQLKICTIGRIDYQKNPTFFNEIALNFPNMKFTWIGDGELKYELTSSNINITGWKNRKEVLELVNDNDIFILTSLWEGMPIALLEAMFLEKICLVTDVIGNKDVIVNNENGYIINEENYKNIIENLNSESCYKVSKNAKKTIVEELNIKNMCKKYKKIYN